jgi:multisubunit Na+/H+ antiporter MnhG subunit
MEEIAGLLEPALGFARTHPIDALAMILAVLGVVGAQYTYRKHPYQAWWRGLGYPILIAAVIIISSFWLASWGAL